MNLGANLRLLSSAIRNNKTDGLMNLISYCISLVGEPVFVKASPIFVQIEPTRKCNLSCEFCDRSIEKNRIEELSFNAFKAILDKLPFLRKISLVGVGEPLLNKELFQMISYAKSKDIKIGFATNATLLNDEINKEIISSGVDWMNISLDGATKQTFEKIRRGATFEKVIEKISKLALITKTKKRPELSIWFLAVKENVHELSDLILLANDTGIKKINIQTAHHWAKGAWLDKVKSEGIVKDFDVFKPAFLKAENTAKAHGISLDYVNMPDTNTKRRCKWPWRACYITADGFVTPCCIHGTDPEIINFGNIFKEEFEAIWNSASYQDFRKRLKSKVMPPICIGCPSYYDKIKVLKPEQ